MDNQPKRPFRTSYPGGLREGYCATLVNAVAAATSNCLHNGERRASVCTHLGKPVATIAATPMGALVTMHGVWRLPVEGYRQAARATVHPLKARRAA